MVLECVTACLRFGVGGLALCGAERQAGNPSRTWDTVRRASLSKAEASRPHSKGILEIVFDFQGVGFETGDGLLGRGGGGFFKP